MRRKIQLNVNLAHYKKGSILGYDSGFRQYYLPQIVSNSITKYLCIEDKDIDLFISKGIIEEVPEFTASEVIQFVKRFFNDNPKYDDDYILKYLSNFRTVNDRFG